MVIPTSLRFLPALLVIFSLQAARLQAEWPQFRGPNNDFTSPVTGLPADWNWDSDIAWKIPMPGESAANPVVWGNNIFLSSFDYKGAKTRAMCVKLDSGEIVWDHVTGPGQKPRERGRENTWTECTPATDGKHVVFLYGSGVFVAFDFAGKELWKRNIVEEYGPFIYNFDYGASPMIYDGKVYVAVLRRDTPSRKLHKAEAKPGTELYSYVLCVDIKTGKNIWKKERSNVSKGQPVVGESQEAYTTPLLFKNGDRHEIVVHGANKVTSQNPETGEEFWSYEEVQPTGNKPRFRVIASPSAYGDIILATVPQGGPTHAFRVSGNKTEKLWEYQQKSWTPDVPTIAPKDGIAYVLGGKARMMQALDIQTGKPFYAESLNVRDYLRASPVIADGKIYLTGVSSQIVVLKEGKDFKVLSSHMIGDGEDEYPMRASVIPARDGHLLIRGAAHLYCVKKE